MRGPGLIEEKLRFYQDIISSKKFTIEFIPEPLIIKAHPLLTEILISNLLINALTHAPEGGKIIVEIKSTMFTIANTSTGTMLDEETIFRRFEKGKRSEGMGLGLSIVKEICTTAGYVLSYNMKDSFHRFSIDFKEESYS